uniref:Uncharacterized protein n=1 Tax=Glossina pallidipes TaxID=7398 RepID=A0A1A9ZS58_GLOPL
MGRLGNFPYGNEISTTTDFYSVGWPQNSFLSISDFIAQFEECRKPLIDHLVERKINLWDIIISELSAKALRRLTHHAPDYMVTVVIDQLFSNTDSIDINTRHGSVLALGAIALVLSKMDAEKLSKDGCCFMQKRFNSPSWLPSLIPNCYLVVIFSDIPMND